VEGFGIANVDFILQNQLLGHTVLWRDF